MKVIVSKKTKDHKQDSQNRSPMSEGAEPKQDSQHRQRSPMSEGAEPKQDSQNRSHMSEGGEP
jgi:negative regulator of genetic competence, sporulation and motility